MRHLRSPAPTTRQGRLVVARATAVVLWLAFGYGAIGAILSVYIADTYGRPSMLRVGAALVLLAGVSAVGLSRVQAVSTRH
ncbi:hypothetical protein [Knoellia locipacati]|uniref:hypothetical protein n=1 Tax=Knoellia locipacati TaxID=882824 RepID=UPI0011BF56F1|nr:hypothetical protein [Knoellia locipacati]